MSARVAPTPCGPLSAAMFDARFRCVMTTPFGVAVDPDVNCTKAGSLPDGASSAGGVSSGGLCSASDGATIARLGHAERSDSTCWTIAADVITARALHERSPRAAAPRYAGRPLVAAGGSG